MNANNYILGTLVLFYETYYGLSTKQTKQWILFDLLQSSKMQ